MDVGQVINLLFRRGDLEAEALAGFFKMDAGQVVNLSYCKLLKGIKILMAKRRYSILVER